MIFIALIALISVLLLSGIGFLVLGSEAILSHRYHAQKAQSGSYRGLELALDYANREVGLSRLPSISIFPETMPAAQVVTTPFGRGTILLSQGLLSRFEDEEVVAVMQQALQKLSKTGSSFRSACSALLVYLEGTRRAPWTPGRALIFWAALPIRRFLERRARSLDVFYAVPENPSPAWHDALHKVSCSRRIFS